MAEIAFIAYYKK